MKDDRTPPELIYSVKPHFSKEEAKRIKWGKTITTVQLTVDTNGQVQEAHVIKSSLETMKSKDADVATLIDQKCIEAVNQYRFEPATLNRRPVSVKINIEVSVRIF